MRAALLVVEAGRDPARTLAWLRQLAPDLARLGVLIWASTESGWWAEARWVRAASRLEEGEAALVAVRQALAGWGPQVQGEVAVELDPAAIEAAVKAVDAELIAWGPVGDDGGALVSRLVAHGRRLPHLLVGEAAGPPRPPRVVACPYLDDVRLLAPLGAVLPRLGAAPPQALLLQLRGPAEAAAQDLASARVAGLGPDLRHDRLDAPLLDLAEAARRTLARHQVDLVALALSPATPLAPLVLQVLTRRASESLPAALLVVPAPGGEEGAPLAATDALRRPGQPLRLRVEQADRLGAPLPFEGALAVLVEGRVLARVQVEGGVLTLPDPGEGIGAVALADAEAPARVRVPLVRVATAASLDLLQAGEGLAAAAEALSADAPAGRRLALVRLGRGLRLDLARRALAAAPGTLLLDASLELDDAADADLPERVDAVRLVRLARHLGADGLPVDRVGLHEPQGLHAPGLHLWDLQGPPPPPRAVAATPTFDLPGRLDALCGTLARPGCRVEVELDNAAARRRWLALIDRATTSIHLQTYIVEEDAVSVRIAAALARAAARGVAVRVLVDSLFSRHGSLGARNPLLERLAAAPGVTVLQHRPVLGLPALEDLKLRSHRKLLIADGRVAVVTGRNLGARYLTGFDEVLVTPQTPGMTIPWLDAGARLAGPVVADVQAAFLAAWAAAGGGEVPPQEAPAAGEGEATVRLVLHEGLRDTHTLDAYRALIDGARARLWVVNTFPLQRELLAALLRARARGVQVRVLVGNVRPVYSDPSQGGRVPFPAATTAREVATQVIHGRLDALARAGATVGEVALHDLPGWDPARGPVRPHVHAKLLIADGRFTAVGSANLDVTAGYWESEALALVDSPTCAGRLEAALDALLARAIPFDTLDPAWQALAQRRAWLSANWPSVVG